VSKPECKSWYKAEGNVLEREQGPNIAGSSGHFNCLAFHHGGKGNLWRILASGLLSHPRSRGKIVYCHNF
jgi:hypothetical protein